MIRAPASGTGSPTRCFTMGQPMNRARSSRLWLAPQDQPGGIVMAPRVLLSMAGLLTLSRCAVLALGAAAAPTIDTHITLDGQHTVAIYLGPYYEDVAPAFPALTEDTLRELKISYRTPERYRTLVQLTWRKFLRLRPTGSQQP